MSKKKNVLIMGHRGGIGKATQEIFVANNYRIIPVNSDIIDFEKSNSDQQIQSLLTNAQPDVVVNCAGVFENGYEVDHHRTMSVNFGSNWSILRHYMQQEQKQKTCIILVGSSSYTHGRKQYPLYSASKAALFNLWQSAEEIFRNTEIRAHLINPVRTRTAMASVGKKFDPNLDYLEPEQVASKIFELVGVESASVCVDMTFEDAK